MHCPVCNYPLQTLSVTTNSGGHFEVEHCGRCGGTWFDPYEINRIPYHEVVKIASVAATQRKDIPIPEKLYCPRDHRELTHYSSEAVPKGVQLMWCKKCLGLWASQKALWDFKKHQEETIQEYKVGHKVFPALSVVFIPTVSVILLFLSTFITVRNLDETRTNQSQAASLIQNLSVTRLSPSSVAFYFTTPIDVKAKINLGTSIFDQNEYLITPEFSKKHKLIMPGILADKNYIYTIILEDENGKIYTTKSLNL